MDLSTVANLEGKSVDTPSLFKIIVKKPTDKKNSNLFYFIVIIIIFSYLFIFYLVLS